MVSLPAATVPFPVGQLRLHDPDRPAGSDHAGHLRGRRHLRELREDTIFGLGGDDTIYGEGGSDTIDGGSGRDGLLGADGADCLDGGADKDDLKGEAGDDKLLAKDGTKDKVNGGPSPDKGRFDPRDDVRSVANPNFTGGC